MVEAVQVVLEFVMRKVLLTVWEWRDFHRFKEGTGEQYQHSF